MASFTFAKPLSVQVIIVSYRTAELVSRSLAALLEERKLAQKVNVKLTCYVIDNSGIDFESIDAYVKQHGFGDWVHVVKADRNGGFAYGNNRGFEYGFKHNPVIDYFFLLNPDAIVRPEAVLHLLDFMEKNPSAGTAGSSLENERGELWPMAFRFPRMLTEVVSALDFGPLYRAFEDKMVARTMGSTNEEVDWFPGASMMVRARAIKELGGMDESFFLYYEETDFCLKLKRHGWTNWYVPISRVMHIAGQSSGITAEGADTRKLPAYWFDSRRRYFIKNHGVRYAVLMDALANAANVANVFHNTLRGRQKRLRNDYVKDFLRGSCVTPQNCTIEPNRERLAP